MYHAVGLRFLCSQCSQGYMFYSEFMEHKNVHTVSAKNCIFCRKRGCDKSYSSSRARNFHERQHGAKAIHCDYKDPETDEVCGMEFFGKQFLDQHFRGAHGEGWNARCGKHCKWPAEVNKHQKECDQCADLKRKSAKKVNKEAKQILKDELKKRKAKH